MEADPIEVFLARNPNRVEAAKDLVRGLMRGNRSELKLGYTHENAALAAQGHFDLPDWFSLEVRAHAFGFCIGLRRLGDAPSRAPLDAVSTLLGDAYQDGLERGLAEDPSRTYPA